MNSCLGMTFSIRSIILGIKSRQSESAGSELHPIVCATAAKRPQTKGSNDRTRSSKPLLNGQVRRAEFALAGQNTVIRTVSHHAGRTLRDGSVVTKSD